MAAPSTTRAADRRCAHDMATQTAVSKLAHTMVDQRLLQSFVILFLYSKMRAIFAYFGLSTFTR